MRILNWGRFYFLEVFQKAYARDRKDAQRFGIGLALLFTVLTAVAFFRGRPELTDRYYPVALTLIALALLFPLPLWPLQKLAASVIKAIAWLNTQAVLALVFYLLFAPIGLFLRIIRKDMLNRNLEPEKKSYWLIRESKKYNPADDEKQF
jgi:hypothetical protein